MEAPPTRLCQCVQVVHKSFSLLRCHTVSDCGCLTMLCYSLEIFTVTPRLQ